MELDALSTYLPSSIMDELRNMKNDCVVISDYQSGHFIYLSPSVMELTGYEKEVFLEKGASFLFSLGQPEDVARVTREISHHIQHMQEEANFGMSFCNRIKHALGHFVWLESTVCPILFTKNGDLTAFFGVWANATGKMEAERFLWEELSQLCSPEEIEKLKEEYLTAIQYCRNNPSPTGVKELTFKTEPHRGLSHREKEILALLAKGFSSKNIAEALHIQVSTAEKHRKNILSKFKVKNTAELITEASRSYWLGD